MATTSSNGLTLRNVINMTNGVVGLSILTMPYCFDQCGVILGTLILLLCAAMTSYSCKILISSCTVKKTKTYEYLGLRVLGHKGKVLIEISIILLLLGSLITTQQIVNDTGPSLLSKLLGIQFKIPHTVFMTLFTLFITLPLNLSKKLDKLSQFSAFAVFFYFVFGFYLMWLSMQKIADADLMSNLKFWNLPGVVTTFPIFSISFSCQTVVFVVYDELGDEASRQNINKLVDSAIVLAFFAYFLAGTFGCIAFSDVIIHGNSIGNIPATSMSFFIQFGFIICVIAGFPFMVFPCRNSINTLLYSSSNDILESESYMPERRFKMITYTLIICTAMIAIIVPNIEFVLSLTGATSGSLICYIWPSVLFILSHSKQTGYKKLFINMFLFTGIVILCVCTYTTLIKYQPTKQDEITLLKTSPDEIPHTRTTADVMSQAIEVHAEMVELDPTPPKDPETRREPPNPNFMLPDDTLLNKKELKIDHVLNIVREIHDSNKTLNNLKVI